METPRLIQHLNHNRDLLFKFSNLISQANQSVNLGLARESLFSSLNTEYLRSQ